MDEPEGEWRETLPDTERSIQYRAMSLEEHIGEQCQPTVPWRAEVLKALRRVPFRSALEIGCSIGMMVSQIRDKYKLSYAAGFDFNSAAIEEARFRHPLVSFRTLDAEHMHLAYNPKQFDLIFSAGTIMHMGEELHRHVLDDILALEPKFVLHYEHQGSEYQRYSKHGGERFLRRHDYIGHYAKVGGKLIRHIKTDKYMTVAAFDLRKVKREIPEDYGD